MSPMSMPNRTGSRYWRSLDDLARTPEFQEMVAREFPGEVWESIPPATRRQFLKVMGASLALAGLTSCRWPREEIVPFASRPEGRDPGVPSQFATALELGGAAMGLLVTSYGGRPIKVEGNPNHPDSLGAASAVAQASVLSVYDPDRSRSVVLTRAGGEYRKSVDAFREFAAAHFAPQMASGGGGLAVLAEPSASPSRQALASELLAAFPSARWYEWSSLDRRDERAGWRAAFGRPVRPVLHFDRARVVACLDADPLMDHPAALRHAAGFARSRRPGPGMARLWVAEPAFTVTGAAADERLPLARGAVGRLLAALVRELEEAHGVAVGAAGPPGAELPEAATDFVARLAADLAGARGAGMLVAGPAQPAPVHTVVAAVNAALGNLGTVVEPVTDPVAHVPYDVGGIEDLAGDLEAGRVETLVILGGNPAYDAPADLELGSLLEKVPVTVHLAPYRNETSRRCTWHVPEAHYMESWGDTRAWDGTVSVVQPLIEPLHGGITQLDLLSILVGRPERRAWDVVRGTLMADFAPPGDFEPFWRRCLHDGVVEGTRATALRTSVDAGAVARAGAALSGGDGGAGFELIFTGDRKVHDGRFANNGWLQELPDAITTVTWDNVLTVAPSTARRLGLASGDVARVRSGGATVELPVYVLPGQAAGTMAVSLGYGRRAAGQVGDGVGVDVAPLRTSGALWRVDGVEVSGTGRRITLAVTQDHHAIDAIGFEGRLHRLPELIREATVEAYLADPTVVRTHTDDVPLFSLWKEHTYEGDQWGMAIDLNACIGCTACVVACQAENNIPVVGRQQVINGREMHWIRLDRYFSGTPDLADVVFQPVACVHCEDAPCEQVCPVAATQHTHDGLNAMVYNRCVGTRYCSNNCPYKVRRFNFFNYQKGLEDLEKMRYNPEVTVRSRGVMEKCTYCVQRIEAARIAAKKEDRPIADGEVVPACGQTCPTRAIVFGNLNDPESEIARLRDSDRAYAMLGELNIRPRTHYLAKLRNPAEEHPGAGAGGGHGEGHGSAHDPHGKETA